MYLYDKQTKKRKPKKTKAFVLAGVCLLVASIVLLPLLFLRKTPQDSNSSPTTGNTQSGPASFNKQQYSTSDPSSQWIVVNKKHPLNPKTYAPSLAVPNVALRSKSSSSEMNMRPETAKAVETLFAAAKQDGLSLMVASGYRSYQLQVSVYGNEVKTYGQAAADRESARPGYSEHQTGWALDVEPASRKCELSQCFGDLAEGKWLAANAYKYGFIIRYTSDKEAVTGYKYEPWHIRYVGTDLSTEMRNQGTETLEEFFNIQGGTAY